MALAESAAQGVLSHNSELLAEYDLPVEAGALKELLEAEFSETAEHREILANLRDVGHWEDTRRLEVSGKITSSAQGRVVGVLFSALPNLQDLWCVESSMTAHGPPSAPPSHSRSHVQLNSQVGEPFGLR